MWTENSIKTLPTAHAQQLMISLEFYRTVFFLGIYQATSYDKWSKK